MFILGISQGIAIVKNILVDHEVEVAIENNLEDLVVIAAAKNVHADHTVVAVVEVKGLVYFILNFIETKKTL